ncbi:MAG: glycosyltransferase family 39 protein [Pseudomonadota bacterium]
MSAPSTGPISLQSIGRSSSITGAYFLALSLYFLLQLLIRLTLSDTLDLDEAEQAFLYARPDFGYGTQPPLYTWLQWLMFSIFGMNLFALSALKNLILFGTYGLMFHLARPMVGTLGAMAASASMLLLPAIGWESQRDLTHSVLLTFIACLALWSYFALLRKPSLMRYALFGMVLGLGMLTKYNFLVFIFGLTGASFLVPEHRRVLWQRPIWITIVASLACFLPHGLWLLTHLEMATDGTLAKMTQGQDAGYFGNVVRGTGSIALAALAFLTPLWLIYGWLGRKDLRAARLDRQNPNARFFLLLYAGFFTVLMLLVLSGEARSIKSRWMLPLLFSVPLGFFLILPIFSAPRFQRRVLQVAGCFAVVILIALPARMHFGTFRGSPLRAHHPYAQLSAEIEKLFPQVRTLILEDKLVAGNLYFQRPTLRTLLLDDTLRTAAPIDEDVLLLLRDDVAPSWLQRFQMRYPAKVVVRQGRLRLPMLYGNRQIMSFQYVHLSSKSGYP